MTCVESRSRCQRRRSRTTSSPSRWLGSRFFTTDHYNGYKAVLVRLANVDVEELSELITDSWRLRAPRKLVEALERQ